MNKLNIDKFYIDGHWVAPASVNTIDVINPATEATICSVAVGSKNDVNTAVQAAKRAFESYALSSVEERISLLEKILVVYKRRYSEMASTISEELGAPITLCENAQVQVGVGHLEATIASLKTFRSEYSNEVGDLIIREPIGVCGLITPWNWPMNQIALKVFPALAAGCTVILKPSEITPLNALLFAEILDEAGVPNGVFNLVNGDGPAVGSAMSKHPDIQMMSFTGSTSAGAQITKDAADTIKRVTLELGGKSPNIVLPDDDLEEVVERGIKHCFLNSGQNCNAPTRMLIHKSQYEQVNVIAAEVAEQIIVGDPSDKTTQMGPLVSAIQFDRVQSLIKTAINDGAQVVAGGEGYPADINFGYFVRPTIIAEVSNSDTICQEEIFGPVLVLISYEDEDEAIKIANDTPYGLAAYIQSGDASKAMQLMRRLRAGMVRINGADIDYASPFGGYKLSGNGREGGLFGIEDYCETKAVARPN